MRSSSEKIKIGNRIYQLEYNSETDTIRYQTPQGCAEFNHGMAMLVLSNKLYNKISLKTAEQFPERY